MQPEMVAAIERELALQRQYLGQSALKTVYFGGGTPSLLSEDELHGLMNSINSHLGLTNVDEITLEANPDDLSRDKLAQLRAAGINRLSIGIQSFQEEILTFLHRSHDLDQARNAFYEARQQGFNNVSIDLMFAIPGQSPERWQENVREAIRLRPEHISAYSLTLEPRTAFGRWHAKGKLTAVPDDDAASEMLTMMDMLEGAGYIQYEVSNFCLPGFQARHNSSYWKRVPYLGIGPSAHSFDGVSRQANVANNYRYLSALQKNEIPFTREVLTRDDRINEYLLTSLRTLEGADLQFMKTTFDHDLLNKHPSYLDSLMRQNLADVRHHSLVLTRSGRLLADKIASDLFEVGEGNSTTE